MKKLIVFVIFILSTALVNASDAQVDKLLNEYNYQFELAKKLPTTEIISRIALLNDVYRDSPLEFALKAGPFASVISDRSKSGDFEAAYYQFAFFDRLVCESLTDQKMSSAPKVCNDMIRNLKSLAISESKKNIFYIASSKRVLGSIYKDGKVTTQSNILSTEWYYKAAEDFYKNGYRDAAITSLEESLKLMPNYVPALNLRKVIVGY